MSGGRREAAAEPALQAAPPDTDGAPLCLSVSVACPNQYVGVMTKFCTQPPSRPASGPVARSVFFVSFECFVSFVVAFSSVRVTYQSVDTPRRGASILAAGD